MSEDFSVWFLLCVVFNVLVMPKDVHGLKLLRVAIPQFVAKGETATLRCEYKLENDRLYSVMWYKDHEEFYRFVPRNEPKQHSYRLEGIRVNHHHSDEQQVEIKVVSLKADGIYRCEVSAEAPSFTSVHGEGRMEVIALPSEDPEITGEQRVYSVGDVISLNCTSGKSYPAARLSWFVNDIEVGSDYEAVLQQHGLHTSIIGLKFVVKPHHFTEGRMVVRCVSTIHTGKNTVVEQRIVPPIDNREALLLVQGGGHATIASATTLLLLLLVSSILT
ncbi:UNVERIFIED_CONTAM: hypothetical protein PYX00_008416 [Menopon gallinae]|uniref:Ig-like domain-containing protein n=1 Tax=Menopon gallinae TaxID=328185 RepID=A0AAW2HN89_9NEOP